MTVEGLSQLGYVAGGAASVCKVKSYDEISNSEEPITSQYLSICNKEFLNGSGFSASSGKIEEDPPSASSNSEEFPVPDTFDVISEILLTMEVSLPTLGVHNDNNVSWSNTLLLDLVKKIKIHVGNFHVQTILPGDIYNRNWTELGYLLKEQHNLYNAKSTAKTPTGITDLDFSVGQTAVQENSKIKYCLSIPFSGRTITDMRRALLQAGAQYVHTKVVVEYNYLGAANASLLLAHAQLGNNHQAKISTGITTYGHKLSDPEKDHINKNSVNRAISTHAGKFIQVSNTTSDTVQINLDSIQFNVSHILLSFNASAFKSDRSVITLTGGTRSHDVESTSCSTWTARASSSLHSDVVGSQPTGVFLDWLDSINLKVGSHHTGEIQGTCMSSENLENFSLVSTQEKGIYIVKLAEQAFSLNGLPFATLKNRNLVLKFNKNFISNLFARLDDTTNSQTAYDGLVGINVTIIGSTIQTTSGGNITFMG